ncbi:MAG: acyclic terpene utilization AtuA family protein, partial [Chloroflexota bacterium]|nr:acyclic terpene utilization AtuA family protein [Chloroflexota bacterium]
LAGRSSDTSLFAALPVQWGFPHGLVWHLAKLVECGSMIAIPNTAGSAIFATLRDDHFLVEALDAATSRCTTISVAAHTLYENPSPYYVQEPSGTLDTTEAKYEQVNDQTVKVWGSKFIPAEKYTVKLEGVEKMGYRTITIFGIRDPILIDQIDTYLDSIRKTIRLRAASIGISQEDYSLSFRVYGKNGVMGPMEPVKKTQSHELGVLIQAIAKTEELSRSVLAMARVQALHGSFEGKLCTSGCAAFPFSPSDIAMGEAYRFSVWHLVEPGSPSEMFPVEIVEV